MRVRVAGFGGVEREARPLTDLPLRSPQRSPHGPTRARRPVGELPVPPPVARQVRQVTLIVEALDDGRWRFSQPHVDGWQAAARTPGEVVAVIRQGLTEAQVAAYSTWRGHVPDVSAAAYRRHRPTARSRKRCDVYGLEEWKLLDDGRWISPKGLRFPEERQVVQRVMAGRVAAGLPARPDPVQPDPIGQQAPAVVVSMVARNVTTMTARGETA